MLSIRYCRVLCIERKGNRGEEKRSLRLNTYCVLTEHANLKG